MDPMTVLIRATDPTTLATTLEGIITAKNETPHRVVVFAVNPPPALTATGRLDFHFDVAKEKFTPVALTAMWMQAVRHCGDEKIVMMRDVVYPGPYWLDMLNQTGRVNLLSRVIFTPPDLAVANTIYRPAGRPSGRTGEDAGRSVQQHAQGEGRPLPAGHRRTGPVPHLQEGVGGECVEGDDQAGHLRHVAGRQPVHREARHEERGRPAGRDGRGEVMDSPNNPPPPSHKEHDIRCTMCGRVWDRNTLGWYLSQYTVMCPACRKTHG